MLESNLNSVKMKLPAPSAQISRGDQRPYHHGGLRDALIEAAEEILAEKGVEGFTLREAARRAGVSPAAPAHHFGDAAGLLTEVAILGFEGLAEALRAGMERGGDDPLRRLREQGRAYVQYAMARPGRFKLIFRKEKLACEDERLHRAGSAAFALLQQAIGGVTGRAAERFDARDRAAVLAAWSLVHGFAHLAIDGEFDRMTGGTSRADFVDQMLPGVLEWLPVAAQDDGKR